MTLLQRLPFSEADYEREALSEARRLNLAHVVEEILAGDPLAALALAKRANASEALLRYLRAWRDACALPPAMLPVQLEG